VPRDTLVPEFSVARRVPHAARSDFAASDLARGDRVARHDRAVFPVFFARFLLILSFTFSFFFSHFLSLTDENLLLLHLSTSLPT